MTSRPATALFLSPVLLVLIALGLGEDVSAEVNRWAPMGPRGADLRAVAVHPADPSVLFVATSKTVYKSTDAGRTWSAKFTTTDSLRELAIDALLPDVIYAGVSNRGIFKSVDAGETWTHLDGPEAFRCCLFALAVDPASPSTLFASDNFELLRSTDGGQSWDPVGSGLPPLCCLEALVADPQKPATLYAGSSAVNRVLRSVDGAVTWSEFGGDIGGDVDALAIDPNNSATLYAVVRFEGLMRSLDGGRSWSRGKGLPTRAIHDVAFDPQDSQTMYAASAIGLLRSRDGGVTWSNVVDRGLSDATVLALVAATDVPGTRYAGTTTGIFKTTDAGATWEPVHNGLTDQVVLDLVIDPLTPTTLYAGTIFDGVFKSVDGGATWRPINNGRSSSGSILVLDPSDPSTIYSTGVAGLLFKSVDSGASWSLLEEAPGSLDAVAIDPQNPQILFVGNNDLYGGISKSVDGGASWERLDTGFESTRVDALVVDPHTSTTIYAGTSLSGNSVLKSVDGGASWQTVSSGALAGFWVSTLVIDPTDPATVYAGVRGGDHIRPGGVFRSQDGGATWSPFNRGISSEWVRTLTIDPWNPKRLFAGSHGGGAYEIEAVAMSVGDRVWIDENANGVQDPAERGLRGASLSLVGDGIFESTTTGPDGSYRFEALPPGEYTLRVSLPTSKPAEAPTPKAIFDPPFPAPPIYVFTSQDAGEETIDSDIDPETGETDVFTLAVGENKTALDAGVISSKLLLDLLPP